MNRFIIGHVPQEIVQSMCDKHVVKMPLEEAQMLCTVLRKADPEFADAHGLYKMAHKNHPCTLWAGETRSNYMYAFMLWQYMCLEYTYRYGKHHATERFVEAFREGAKLVPEGLMTRHPECFGEHTDLKSDEFWPVDSYRKFYNTKQHRFKMTWTNRDVPYWFEYQNWEIAYA